jgi:hypothetical protein
VLKDEREASEDGEDERHTLLAVLEKEHNQAEAGHYSEEAKLEILTAAKKLVKVPEVLCPRHGENQKNGEPYAFYAGWKFSAIALSIHLDSTPISVSRNRYMPFYAEAA